MTLLNKPVRPVTPTTVVVEKPVKRARPLVRGPLPPRPTPKPVLKKA